MCVYYKHRWSLFISLCSLMFICIGCLFSSGNVISSAAAQYDDVMMMIDDDDDDEGRAATKRSKKAINTNQAIPTL